MRVPRDSVDQHRPQCVDARDLLPAEVDSAGGVVDDLTYDAFVVHGGLCERTDALSIGDRRVRVAELSEAVGRARKERRYARLGMIGVAWLIEIRSQQSSLRGKRRQSHAAHIRRKGELEQLLRHACEQLTLGLEVVLELGAIERSQDTHGARDEPGVAAGPGAEIFVLVLSARSASSRRPAHSSPSTTWRSSCGLVGSGSTRWA